MAHSSVDAATDLGVQLYYEMLHLRDFVVSGCIVVLRNMVRLNESEARGVSIVSDVGHGGGREEAIGAALEKRSDELYYDIGMVEHGNNV